MQWEQVLTLLHIAQVTNDYPILHKLRDRALAELSAADLDTLHFASQVDNEEPLEDEE